jgi:hypothetical protein
MAADRGRRVKLIEILRMNTDAELVLLSVTIQLSCFSIVWVEGGFSSFIFAATGTSDVSVANIIFVRTASEEALYVDC